MKHFKYIRKILIILEVMIAIALAIVLCFIPMDIFVKAGLLVGVAIFFLIFYLLDHLHNRYLDDMLEELTFLIEELVGKQEVKVFSELEDTLLSRLQHQLLVWYKKS